MPTKKFQRKIEDFVCGHCGQKVIGTGYTDHCPACLWSRHVDVNPGDRLAQCQGAMKPLSVEMKGGEKIIYYKCQLCGFEHRVRAAAEDDFEAILKLTSQGV